MSKQFVRALFLGAVVASASACGGAESETQGSEDTVGAVEQRACAVGTYQYDCREWGTAGLPSPSCGAGSYQWKFWTCKQFQAGSQWYHEQCGAEQYVCGSSATTRPVSSVQVCKQFC
ncbi:hypothetical protein LY474_00795 [Myxococcus stipitatus]|uniref:hypothetical protein n=1 Tax=Myxococcus stipitatus TaxID=83455 RepID=UPI001F39EB9D|nr:hypothetical protein [Myxococcus stipitatus]MCE9666334.1 hypothetical protein [Myxococcus stipitatus]